MTGPEEHPMTADRPRATEVTARDAHIEWLRAKVERLRQEMADMDATHERARAAEAESARLASVVAKVEALADEWEAALEGADDYFKASEWAACLRANLPNLRAALASVAPDTATPGEARHQHAWVLKQNVTSRGYELPPYEVCRHCGSARSVDPDDVR